MARYRAIMVLGPETALFTLDCPKCGAQVQLLRAIPGALREEVRASAQQVGAGGLN
ncbi:UDP-N-acetylmuramoylalanyl-D-glutamate--2,6-diaminopimelate ligase [Senegalimassilia anaerobia]|uniref:UDP-N-acetylmuramoylalanyl-D-glutamate--2, 6-diaminopimelate ligase n=2 Tax=Senegalimassilia anaerobia TaxID=1473216 RepID=A0A369LCH3_9ACTN|nr:UDP-N-acetylmuramoylalanyl-D-glutamate--2,6-diaminopimelate ligase [Senegalimassilia anaerobia]